MNLIHFLCAQRFSGSLFCLFSFSIWALFNIVYCTLDYTVGSTEQCKNAKSNIGDASQSQRNTQNKRLRRMIWWWQYVQSVLFAHSCLLCIRNNVSVWVFDCVVRYCYGLCCRWCSFFFRSGLFVVLRTFFFCFSLFCHTLVFFFSCVILFKHSLS